MFGRDFFFRIGASCGIAFFGSQLMQCAEIFDLAFQFLKRVDQRAQSRNFFDIRLGTLAVRPEVGRRHASFDRG